jgi:hypothetical protein
MELEMIASLKWVLQQPIAFHRVLATVGGSATAGLFLSQCWYCSTRTSDPDGWWTRTQAQWESEIGLTRREQETIRRRLRMRGILEREEGEYLPSCIFD